MNIYGIVFFAPVLQVKMFRGILAQWHSKNFSDPMPISFLTIHSVVTSVHGSVTEGHHVRVDTVVVGNEGGCSGGNSGKTAGWFFKEHFHKFSFHRVKTKSRIGQDTIRYFIRQLAKIWFLLEGEEHRKCLPVYCYGTIMKMFISKNENILGNLLFVLKCS